MNVLGDVALVLVGWEWVKPHFNHYKRFLWLNRDRYPIAGLAFRKRILPSVDDIPVFEHAELEGVFPKRRLVAMDSYVHQGLGNVERPADFLRQQSTVVGFQSARSPFDTLDLETLSRPPGARMNVANRLFSPASLSTYENLAGIFEHFGWDGLFGVSSGETEDSVIASFAQECFEVGIRGFAIRRNDAALAADVLLTTAPMFHSGEVTINAESSSVGPRSSFYRRVLGNRLGDLPYRAIIADSPGAFLDAMNDVRTWGLVRLPRNVYDLNDLVDALDQRRTSHRVLLHQISADPSLLFAALAPIPRS